MFWNLACDRDDASSDVSSEGLAKEEALAKEKASREVWPLKIRFAQRIPSREAIAQSGAPRARRQSPATA